MNRFALAASLIVITWAGFSPSTQASERTEVSAARHSSTAALILSRLNEKELSDLDSDNQISKEELEVIVAHSPIAGDGETFRHYQKVRYTFKVDGVSFLAFYSYLDEEDGGNSYGWATDASGKVIARIADSFFEPVRGMLAMRPTVELRYTFGGQTESVKRADMAFEDTAVSLDSIFEPFSGRAPDTLCYKGDINQVCSMLSSMSKLSDKQYSEGGHGLAHLKGCRVLGRGKPVEARIELSNDYDSETVQIVSVVESCQ